MKFIYEHKYFYINQILLIKRKTLTLCKQKLLLIYQRSLKMSNIYFSLYPNMKFQHSNHF